MKKPFTLYYINQGLLLDLYSILNDGYTEFTELSTELVFKKENKKSANINCNYKLLGIGINAAAEAEKNVDNSGISTSKEKKIHTMPSMLNLVFEEMDSNKLIQNKILKSKEGDYINIPVNLKINSLKGLVAEMSELLKIASSAQQLSSNNSKQKPQNREVDKINNFVSKLCEGEEVFYEEDNYGIFGNINEDYLYRALKRDITNINLMCFAQVKRIYPSGTKLMKNTTLGNINDANIVEQIIRAINADEIKESFNYESSFQISIDNKKVYELEIIALYQ